MQEYSATGANGEGRGHKGGGNLYPRNQIIHLCLLSYSEFISTPSKLKNIPDYGENRTYDYWNATPNALPLELRAQVG